MGRHYSHLNTAISILEEYAGEQPFSHFLKGFFSQNKKYGSRDRRLVSQLCYCYFRLGKAALNLPYDQRIILGLFLCSTEPGSLLEELKPDWNEKTGLDIEEKIKVAGKPFSIPDIFPWAEELSGGINPGDFILSHLRQPDLFLRLRPGYEKRVKQKLRDDGISFREISSSCIALPNGTDTKNLIIADKEAVIQDYNSQKIAGFMTPAVLGLDPQMCWTVWDCCAGSGGKTILLNDIHANYEILLSDVRKSMVNKIKERLDRAGIRNWKFFNLDLTKQEISKDYRQFDLIIADVPCTGSGTWSRTPECIRFFERGSIETFAEKQKKIVSNIFPALHKKSGSFLYITCSVFKKENEEIVEFIREKFSLQLIRMELLKGYDKNADTLFAAAFRV